MSVFVASENGRRLVLDGPAPNDGYTATLEIESGQVTCAVHEYGNGLPGYFADLADSWRGWTGPKTYRSLESELELSAVHNGLGTVTLEVTIRQPWPPEWTVIATLDLDAGAQLQTLAKTVANWVEGTLSTG